MLRTHADGLVYCPTLQMPWLIEFPWARHVSQVLTMRQLRHINNKAITELKPDKLGSRLNRNDA
jgi:hypothetical protein